MISLRANWREKEAPWFLFRRGEGKKSGIARSRRIHLVRPSWGEKNSFITFWGGGGKKEGVKIGGKEKLFYNFDGEEGGGISSSITGGGKGGGG